MILSIKTDNPLAEIGLYEGSKQVEIYTWQAHRELSNTIHIKIEELLENNKIEYADISGVIFFAGPGSFTGLRIGAIVVNTLAQGLNIPAAGDSGKDWVEKAIKNLSLNKKIVTPNYGEQARTTKPKK